MTICDECNKPGKEFCTVLCPEAELIANQDYVKQLEEPIGHPIPIKPLPTPSNSHQLTPTERKIVTFLAAGLTRRDICKLLNIKPHPLRNHIYRIRKKVTISTISKG